MNGEHGRKVDEFSDAPPGDRGDLPPASTFAIRVLEPAADRTLRDEAVVLIDGHEALATLGKERGCWLGRRPDDVVGPGSPWIATDEPHDAMVARCDCSFEECGALTARITRLDGVVVWHRFRHTTDSVNPTRALGEATYVFSADEYDRAVAGESARGTWEPTTRRAAVLAKASVQALDLRSQGLRPVWVEHRGEAAVTISAATIRTAERRRSHLSLEVSLEPGESAMTLATRVAEIVVSGRFVDEAVVTLGERPRPRSTDDTP